MSEPEKQHPIIELTSFTDPYCTWCWGSEPIIGKIEETYGHQVSISYTMGGLVKDIKAFWDPSNGIGGENWSVPPALQRAPCPAGPPATSPPASSFPSLPVLSANLNRVSISDQQADTPHF